MLAPLAGSSLRRESGTFGTCAPRLFGIQMTDLSLFEQVKFTERLQLQFRVEFFNAFNIPTSRTPVPVLPRQGRLERRSPRRLLPFWALIRAGRAIYNSI